MAKQAKTIDFNKLRKRRQRTTTIKRLMILGALIVVVLAVVALNNFLVEESVTTRISDLVEGFGGSGYPVPLPGGVIRDVKNSGDHLAVLNDTNLYLYNKKGKQVGSFQQMTDSTVLLANSGRMLTYDTGAKRYAIHSRSKTLLTRDLDYGIITAGMNERGDYAIVSSSKQAICEINVYNKKFDRIFGCTFAENIVYSVSISPKGTMMAAGWVNGQDGVLQSGLDLYRLGSDTVAATLHLPGALILDVDFQEDDRIVVLTDAECLLVGADGKIKHSFQYPSQLQLVEYEGRETLFVFEERETRRRDVVLLDADLTEQASYPTREKILDIAMTNRRIYVLGENAVYTYDQKLEPVKTDAELPMQYVTRIQAAGDRLYYLTRDEIRVLGQPDPEPGEEGHLAASNELDEDEPAEGEGEEPRESTASGEDSAPGAASDDTDGPESNTTAAADESEPDSIGGEAS